MKREWQPIETASRELYALLWSPKTGVELGWYFGETGETDVTHWLPLPNPPQKDD